MSPTVAEDFDVRAAWLRRFSADAEGNFNAFALRLKEALPERVSIQEERGFFSKGRPAAVTIELGDSRYTLALQRARLKASVSLVVRGIALNTREVSPPEWFAKLDAALRSTSDDAQALSQSLSAFMGG